MYSLFELCVSFLEWIGYTFQLSYEKISVYFNLYLQGGGLISSTLPALIIAIHRKYANWILVSTCNTCVYVVGFIWMMQHYCLPGNISYAYNKCVVDLEWLALELNVTYQQVNILLFVILYLLLILLNVLMCRTVLNYMPK